MGIFYARIGCQATENQGFRTAWGVDTPSFGDNVSVYANAVVVGNITIGNNVSIGAGAVVTKPVPDNCTVVGNPMRIIKKKD